MTKDRLKEIAGENLKEYLSVEYGVDSVHDFESWECKEEIVNMHKIREKFSKIRMKKAKAA